MSRIRRTAALAAVLLAIPPVSVLAQAAFSPDGQMVHANITATGERAGFSPGSPFIWESDADLNRDLNAMASSGARWVRVDFDWPSIQPSGPSSFSWANTDRVVSGILDRGMSVLALPAYTPAWARPSRTTDKAPPAKASDYAKFVAAAVSRYAPLGVHTWEIWNEPNGSQFWSPKPSVAAYTALLRAAYPVVHQQDPSALVLTGGLMPATDSADGSHIAPKTFLDGIYAAGGKGYFDAVAIHPYSYPAMPMDPSTADWNTFYRLPQIHDLMAAHGEGAKKVWGTEYGAPTGQSSAAVSESDQAAMVRQSYDAMGSWSWAGPLLWYCYRDQGTTLSDPEDNFGLARFDHTDKQGWGTYLSVMGSPDTTSSTTTPPSTTSSTAPPSTTTTVVRNTTTTQPPTTSTTAASRPGHGGGGSTSGGSSGGGGKKK